MPILRGPLDEESGKYSSFTRAHPDCEFPNRVVPAITKRMKYHKKRSTKKLHDLKVLPATVRSTVKAMKSFQGVNLKAKQGERILF